MWFVVRLLLFLLGSLLLTLAAFLPLNRQQQPPTYLLILSFDYNDPEITLVDLDGKIVRHLAVPERTSFSSGIIYWRFDNQGYLLHGNQSDGQYLYYGQFGSRHIRKLRLRGISRIDPLSIQFSPDSQWIIFKAGTQDPPQLYLLPGDGREPPNQLPTGGIYTAEGSLLWLDQDWILYENWDIEQEAWNIYRIHRKGGDPRFVTSGRLATFVLPQSEWLIIRDDRSLYRVRTDGSQREPFFSGEKNDNIRFFFAGNTHWRIVEVSNGSNRLIYRTDLDGASPELLFTLDRNDQVEAVSPDTTELIIKRQGGKLYRISRENLAGEELPFSLTENHYYLYWDRDGALYFNEYGEQSYLSFRLEENSVTWEPLNPPNTDYILPLPEDDWLLVYSHGETPSQGQRTLARVRAGSSEIYPIVDLKQNREFRGFYEIPEMEFNLLWIIGSGILLIVLSQVSAIPALVRYYKA